MKTYGSFTIDRNCIHGQAKGCAVAIQFGYNRLLWHPKWASARDGALLNLYIAAPVHDPIKGYRLTRWAVR